MRYLFKLLFGLSLLIPSTALAEDVTAPESTPAVAESDDGAKPTNEKTPKVYDTNRIEWFAMRLIFGSHGVGAVPSFITLRWRYIYGTIVRSAFAFYGRGWEGQSSRFVLAGSQVGLRFPFGVRNEHEIRIGSGLMGGLIVNQLSVSWMENYNAKSMSHGPVVDTEISYIYRFKPNQAIEVGFEAFFPTTSIHFTEVPVGGIPDPALMGFVGVRF